LLSVSLLENSNEFVNDFRSGRLSLNLKEYGFGNGLIDYIADLCFLLLIVGERIVVRFEFVVSHRGGISLFVNFVVDDLNLRRFLRGAVYMLYQPFRDKMVAETFLVRNPVFAVGL